MELIKVTENTYYIKNATNIGIYKINESDVYLIDSGIDSDAAKKIMHIIEEKHWNIKGIINTHSHADHIGGNNYIQSKLNVPIYTSQIESYFINSPILEPASLYGASPLLELENKFLMAESSICQKIDKSINLEILELKGHSIDMIGIKTPDNVYFLGDSLFSTETINKYHLCYIYDVSLFLKTLDYLETLKGTMFIPSHTEATGDLKELINLNRLKVYEICDTILSILNTPKTFENILKEMFVKYNLRMTTVQYVLIGSTLKAYLSYLFKVNKITYKFLSNQMLWEVL